MVRADRRRDPAAGAEAGVQQAVRVVAGEREVVVRRREDRAGGDDLAVGLERDLRHSRLVGIGECCRDLAAIAEGGVQRAVRVVAGEREVRAAPARGDDPPVRCEHERGSGGYARPEWCCDRAAGAEARVERAIRRVADDCELVFARLVDRGAGDEDLAVGLERDGSGPGPRADRRRHLSARAEARVERAGPPVTGERELGVARAGRDDLSVRLEGKCDDDGARSELSHHFAIAAEGWIQSARRGPGRADEEQDNDDQQQA